MNNPYHFEHQPPTGPAHTATIHLDHELAEFLIVSSMFSPAELVLVLKYYREKGPRFVQSVIRMHCRSRRTVAEIRREAWFFDLYCQHPRRLCPLAMYRARPRTAVKFQPVTDPPPAPPVRSSVDRVLMCEI